ncbi:MAG: M3 family metallopeptidase [Labilithrix sp.]
MRNALALGSLVVLVACGGGNEAKAPTPPPPPPATTQAPPPPPVKAPSIMLSKWTGPHGGLPPFDKIKVDEFKPALLAAMDEQRKEIAAIANNKEPATFENTIAALEDAGRTMDRVETIYDIWASTMNSADFKPVEQEMAPELAKFRDEIVQNTALFKRVEAVYGSPDKAKLTPEQQRLTWRRYTSLVRHGAKLDDASKQRMKDINERLAKLYTVFSQNVLADEENNGFMIEKEEDLAGLSDSFKASLAAAAEAKGQKGKWYVANTRSAMEPFETYSTKPALREEIYMRYINRGDNADKTDNNKAITEILRLRAERAKLLGFQTHAHWRLEDSMAKNPERAMQLMEEVWPAAVQRVREEVKDMADLAKKETKGQKTTIKPWDYRFYSEKVRKAKYDLDENEVKNYLQLEKLREGMFWVAGELFNFKFEPLANIPVYHPDVRVFEVKNKTTGAHVGLWYFDPYARPGKRSGAWMNAYRNQERFKGEVTTIVSNNANFVKPKEGDAVLISWTDARTLFHEFGHALHGLSSNVTYPSLSGTNVARDYVEFPSQLLEHWVHTPEVLNKYALHYKTGAPMPKELVAKIEKAATFNQGFNTVEYLSAALIDMKLHLAGAQDINPDTFERDTLKALKMPDEIVMRHRTPQFMHVFSSDGYSAGYYSYLWSDALTADAYNAFTEAKGPYDPAVAERLRKYVFTVGDTIDPAEGFKQFRGRDVDTSALMKKRGFPVTKKAAAAPVAAPAPAKK